MLRRRRKTQTFAWIIISSKKEVLRTRVRALNKTYLSIAKHIYSDVKVFPKYECLRVLRVSSIPKQYLPVSWLISSKYFG